MGRRWTRQSQHVKDEVRTVLSLFASFCNANFQAFLTFVISCEQFLRLALAFEADFIRSCRDVPKRTSEGNDAFLCSRAGTSAACLGEFTSSFPGGPCRWRRPSRLRVASMQSGFLPM